jgi:HK97 family phage major capsid protein
MNPRELRQKRAQLVAQARAILDQADADKRALGQEEENTYQTIMTEVARIGGEIERRERLEDVERAGAQAQGTQVAGREQPEGEQRQKPEGRESAAYRGAFGSYLRGGSQALNAEEVRALQADNDTIGGFLLAPMQFVNELIQAIDNLVWVRQWSTKYTVSNSDSLGAPVLTADPADADWTTELATGSEDSTMAFGRRELTPHPLAKRIKVSRKLLRKVPNAEGLVRDRLAYKFAVTEEKAFLTGTGSGQPLGVFVASSDGISTGRDISTGNTTTAITVDGLISAKYGLKQQYWRNAKWLFHPDAVAQIAKLRDLSGGAGTGQYLWQPSISAGVPDTLQSFPVFQSYYVPNTFTTGLYVGILGDFSNYWIADSTAMEMQRLVELYAETNQVGMIGRLESDGMPVLEEAFVRVKLA